MLPILNNATDDRSIRDLNILTNAYVFTITMVYRYIPNDTSIHSLTEWLLVNKKAHKKTYQEPLQHNS